MATWQAVNVQTGTTEVPKKNATNVTTEVWKVTLTTALANADTIVGPTLPMGCYLSNVRVDTGTLDSSTGLTFEAGYTGALGAFITGSTVGQGGGIQAANVAGTIGFKYAPGSPAVDTDLPILVTITHVATTPVQGTMVIEVAYTASP